MLRLDQLHAGVSGNKWYKLKHNLETARQQHKDTILTFGGAWSNHIVATAAACRLLGFKSVGIIRGEEYRDMSKAHYPSSLSYARTQGMDLHFVSRQEYRNKNEVDFMSRLQAQYRGAYIITEGGDNDLGIKGCREILSGCALQQYTHICCPVGTGATLTGLIAYCADKMSLDPTSPPVCVGFSALKNAGYLKEKIAHNLSDIEQPGPWQLITDYHFGGFAKKAPALLAFMEDFVRQYQIPLDFVYTAKMMYGIVDLIKKGYFPSASSILAIHTGGLQGNRSLPTVYNDI